MAVGKNPGDTKAAPVHFFSHGSTMMLGEESASAQYWEKMGKLALENGVEHIVMMVSETVSCPFYIASKTKQNKIH